MDMDFKALAQTVIDAKNLIKQKNEELYEARTAFAESKKALSERLRLSQDSDQDGAFYHVAVVLDDVVLDCLWGDDDYELTVIKKL